MAEQLVSSRSMWCFRRCVSCWTHHQPAWVPLDYPSGARAHERHDLHLVLRKLYSSRSRTSILTLSIQADSLEVLVIGQAFEGIPWGLFIANSPAYASEVVPLVLRGACTATLQMSWSIGSIIVAAATYSYNKRNDEWAWRGPLALQWVFPVSNFFLALYVRG
jgi:MFS family permease